MSDICPTILIMSDKMGAVRINKSDFDPVKHVLVGDYAKTEVHASGGIGTDSGDQFSDDQLRQIIEDATGKAPHHKTGREKLVSMFNDLNKE